LIAHISLLHHLLCLLLLILLLLLHRLLICPNVWISLIFAFQGSFQFHLFEEKNFQYMISNVIKIFNCRHMRYDLHHGVFELFEAEHNLHIHSVAVLEIVHKGVFFILWSVVNNCLHASSSIINADFSFSLLNIETC